MAFHQVFLSVVCELRNQSQDQEQMIRSITEVVQPLVSDYEIIIVDNGSDDDSVARWKSLTGENGIPNLQVFALTKTVDSDTAAWVGLENSLGDYVVVLDLNSEDPAFIVDMLDQAAQGCDVVLARNEKAPRQWFLYSLMRFIFNSFYKMFSGIDLNRDAPRYRLLSKRVVNFILQHPQPELAYRHLPASAGFSKKNLTYSREPQFAKMRSLSDSIDRGLRLLVSTTSVPMRLVTILSLFGASANIIYSGYVVIIAIIKTDVAPGWVSLSLQQSGMFFLICLVLLVLGEYILNMAAISGGGPRYNIGQELTSARMTRLEKLNIEEGPDTESRAPPTMTADAEVATSR